MSPFRLTILAALGVAVSVSSMVGAPKGKIKEQFELFDADHNGALSVEEIKAAPWADLIAGADADKDGSVTLSEAKDHLGQNAAKRLREAVATPEDLKARFDAGDKDRDGKLSKAELGKLDWLLELDRDEDGFVTMPELRLAVAKSGQAFEVAPTETPSPPFAPEKSLQQGPKHLKPAEHRIASRIALNPSLKRNPAAKARVIALISPSCPVGKRYLPELARIEQAYEKQQVEFIYLATNDVDDFSGLELKSPIVHKDVEPILAALGARSTTDVFVLDAADTLVYRGAISDQYGVGYSKDAAAESYLKDALDSILAGRSIDVPATEAPGCVLDLDAPKVPAGETVVTYHNRISRIVQQNCQECHRAGGVAPFALETYAQVKAKSGMIRRVIRDGTMPPWFAAPPPAGSHSPWREDRALVEADRKDLLAWLEHKTEGDAKDAPLPKVWPESWMIGTPDKVYQIPKPIAIKAEGTMGYQNIRMETEITEDRWVQAWEVQPTAREVVHHVLVFVLPPNGKVKREGGAGSEAYLAAYVPGSSYVTYPEGYGKFLPAGSRLHFQIHYTPNGVATSDQVKLGLRFNQSKPTNVVQVVGISNPKLRIPAGAANHPEMATIPVPANVRLIGLMPHMHVRGKAFRYEVSLPNGDSRNLLEIPRYDFNWQLAYRYEEPPLIPAGSKIKAVGWFDNSSANPANPDPTRTVTWGEQTMDEMMIGYVEYVQVGNER